MLLEGRQTMTRSAGFAVTLAALSLAIAGEAGAAATRLPAGVPAAAVILLRYDANNDGIVTREEMDAGLQADFAAADSNHDNCLNPAEVSAENARRLARDGAQASPLRDWNLDGCVDIREFSNTAHSYFQLADKKKDGRVTMVELRGPSMPIAPPSTAKPSASSASAAANNSLGAPQYPTGNGGPMAGMQQQRY
jgi:EF hand domain-containing protein